MYRLPGEWNGPAARMKPRRLLLPLPTMALLLALAPAPLSAQQTAVSPPPCPAACNCSLAGYPGLSGPLLTLNCSDAGLNHFPGDTPNDTQVLVLARNRMLNLSSLPPLTELRVLDLSYNRISLLDNHWVFEHMQLLSVLSLRGNALRVLKHGSFSGLQNLDSLDLSHNRIKTIELHAFGGLNHLSVLRLGHNQLYELKRKWLLSMTLLQELYVPGNHIAEIEENTFDKLTSLLHVDLSNNALRKVSNNGFLGLRRVKVLNMSENDFVSIPTRELQKVSSLDILLLDGIKIKTLREGDFDNMDVSSISLSFLPNLSVVGKGTFSNLIKLRTLQLHDNPKLLFIHPHAFSGVPMLHRLLLHNNNLITLSSSVRDSIPKLDELHLYHNPLHCDCNIFWLKRDLVAAYMFLNGTGHNYIKEADKLVCNSPDSSSDQLLASIPLQRLDPVCPPTTIAFFSDTQNISIGDDLRLECQVIGVPEPSLQWSLPHGHIVNNTSDTTLSADNTVLTIHGARASDQGTYSCKGTNDIGFDVGSTAVYVHNKDLRLSVTRYANDFITVAWVGSIPRMQMSHFQIMYRQNDDASGDFDKVYLHRGMHSCTLTNLRPMTSYEICIVYRETYSVQCRNFTTDHRVALTQPAITRINVTRIVAGVTAMVGVVVVLCMVKAVTRRLRRRKDYQDPRRGSADADKIPLEPLDKATGTPLCSSRTALLPYSQI